MSRHHPLRVAFVGFRHGHVLGLYDLLGQHKEAGIVAACEEDAATREKLSAEGKVAITHARFDRMLEDVSCDIVAIGDYYGKRGALIIKALKAGKHVISDKPICITLGELKTIETLAKQTGLSVGCQLDMRDAGAFAAARAAIRNGVIGNVHSIYLAGQHPLNYGVRPGWYFEKGKHGGTINDIAIHALDIIPWITGREIKTVNSARNWNARVKQAPWFKEAAQFMLTLDNNAGVIGDVSYFMPEMVNCRCPLAWRFNFWGEKGVLEVTLGAVTLYQEGAEGPKSIPLAAGSPGGYFRDFVAEIRSQPRRDGLTTEVVIRSSRLALQVQRAADRGLTSMPLR